jgi:neutral amino acid transport system ATP-binding protein
VREEAILEVEGVTRRFGGLRALDGASFRVERSSITSLIGPNGAGKSTLFNIVTGFLRPDAGRVLFQGRSITGQPPHRIARAGLVRTFQAPRALARLSVLDNLLLAAPGHPGERLGRLFLPHRSWRRREQEARERAEELLRLVRLQAHAHDLAGTLSGGQRKLLDLARALMAEPCLLLLDEPLAGVSPALRAQLLEHMAEVRRQRGITVLLVEHDLEAVMRVSDRVIVMGEGRVIASGAPDEVRADPAVVDAYLGAGP